MPSVFGGENAIRTDQWLAPQFFGIEKTVRLMRERCEIAFRGGFPTREGPMSVRRATEWIVKDAGPGNRLEELEAIVNFVGKKLQYRRDPSFTELLIDPRLLLARIERYGWAAGDCDDACDLTCSHGATIRLPMYFVLCGDHPKDPTHVYAAMRVGNPSEAWLNGDDSAESGLIACDTASRGWEFGVHPKARARLVISALSPEDEAQVDPVLGHALPQPLDWLAGTPAPVVQARPKNPYGLLSPHSPGASSLAGLALYTPN